MVVFLAFVLVLGTDWKPQIKRYSVYSQNKCGFNKVPRNFCAHVTQHWTGIEMVPCSCSVTLTFLPHPRNLQKWHTSFERTAESSVQNVTVKWTKQIHFLPYQSCYPENTVLYQPRLPMLLPVKIPLKFWHCIVYAQLQIRQDLICISHNASHSILITKDIMMLVTQRLFHQEGWNGTTSELSLL